MIRKTTGVWAILAAMTIFTTVDFFTMRDFPYDFAKASSTAENIFSQYLQDIKERRENYGEPEVSLWQGDAIIIFKPISNIEEEIIVSLGRDGSATLSLGTTSEHVIRKLLRH